MQLEDFKTICVMNLNKSLDQKEDSFSSSLTDISNLRRIITDPLDLNNVRSCVKAFETYLSCDNCSKECGRVLKKGEECVSSAIKMIPKALQRKDSSYTTIR